MAKITQEDTERLLENMLNQWSHQLDQGKPMPWQPTTQFRSILESYAYHHKHLLLSKAECSAPACSHSLRISQMGIEYTIVHDGFDRSSQCTTYQFHTRCFEKLVLKAYKERYSRNKTDVKPNKTGYKPRNSNQTK